MATSSSPIVLVTGVNGFIASAAVIQFLDAGYRVRGTVRSLVKNQQILSNAFQSHIDAGTLELVEVPDIFTPGALDHAVQGVTGIAHVASAAIRKEDLASPEACINQSRNGTVNVLRSAEDHAGPQLQSVVLLSSLATMMSMENAPGKRYTGEEFNPQYVDMAISMGAKSPPPLNYTAAKVAAEQAFWDFIKAPERKSTFAGVSINPSFVIGPVVARVEDPTALVASVRGVWHVFGGGAWPKDFTTPAYVDVRDVGRALVLGVRDAEKLHGQRILVSAYKGSMQTMADILRQEFPDRKDAIRAGDADQNRSPDDVSWGEEEVGMDGSKFEELSGRKYVPYRECIVDTAKSMLPYLQAGKDKELGDEVPSMV